MPSVEGVVTIVQESRFQLTDDAGISRQFVLSPHAPLEPDQLQPLQHTQERVRVRYHAGNNVISGVADRISRVQP